jgi:hypothetical protein
MLADLAFLALGWALGSRRKRAPAPSPGGRKAYGPADAPWPQSREAYARELREQVERTHQADLDALARAKEAARGDTAAQKDIEERWRERERARKMALADIERMQRGER